MFAYLLKRIAGAVGTLVAMSFIVFCLQGVVPADPARAIAGPIAPAATVEAIRRQLGLDQHVMVRYGHFLSRLSRGDLGTSIRTRQPVAADVLRYLPATVELILVALIFGVSLAGALTLLQFVFHRSEAIRLAIIAAGSMPIFLMALLFAYFFWFRLGWLPGGGRLGVRDFSGPTGLNLVDGLLLGRPEISLDAFSHIILPALTLALPIAVAVGRSLSGALHDVMRQPYIRTARGHGLGETRILLRHGLRNALSAPLAMVGLQIVLTFGNLLVVERVFSWPGLGLYAVQAFASADLPAVLGVFLVLGIFYLLVSILLEIGQSLADPRIRL